MRYLFCILLLGFQLHVTAQLCQGSLGDPLINLTFGQGSNPGAQLNATAIGYQYTPNDCPADGFYSIRNNSIACFGPSWHTLSGDHTQNGQGYFMLVNASIDPSEFYLDTVRGLCPNTTYEFSAWIVNMNLSNACNGSAILPNLTYRVETLTGTVLKSYQTGDISRTSTPTWKQFGSFFTTPAGTQDVVLRLINNASGGCGNDLALDDITFRPCGPLLNPKFLGQAGTTISYCEGVSKSFTLSSDVSGGFSTPVYQWQRRNGTGWQDIPGATQLNYPVTFPPNQAAGSYAYRLSVAEAGNAGLSQCRIASAPLSIVINENPVISTMSNSPVCANEALTLTASGGVTYRWYDNAGFTSNTNPLVFSPASSAMSAKYYVEVTSSSGCTKTDSATVQLKTAPTAMIGFSDTSICKGENIQLSVAAQPGVTYLWTPATGLSSTTVNNPVASPGNITNYMVVVANASGCRDSADVQVNVVGLPGVDAGPDKFLLAGQVIKLYGIITGKYLSFQWLPAEYITNEQTLQPLVNPPSDKTYILVVNSACGIATDSVHVKYYKGIYVPNAFTPNGDGINDTWRIPILYAYKTFSLRVYNRYGQLVYENRDNYNPWNGKYQGMVQPMGTYVYLVELPEAPFLLKGGFMILQ